MTVKTGRTEEELLARLRLWLSKAASFHSRLDHQRYKAPKKDLPADWTTLHDLKPPDDYHSDGEVPLCDLHSSSLIKH